MIDVHYASLTSQGVQHGVFYLDGHPSRYQPRPRGLNFGEQMGTGIFPLVIAVPHYALLHSSYLRPPGPGWKMPSVTDTVYIHTDIQSCKSTLLDYPRVF